MKKAVICFLGLCGMLLAISLAVTLTLNSRWLYIAVMEAENIVQEVKYSREEILANYDALIEYNSIFFTGALDLPTLPMSEGGIMHFAEVKNIFVALQIIGIICLALIIAYTLYSIKKQIPDAINALLSTAIFTVTVPSFVALCIATNWDATFTIFHKIFFRNDLWLFNSVSDPVILILPDVYFLCCALMIICIVIIWSALCLAGYFILKKKLIGKD